MVRKIMCIALLFILTLTGSGCSKSYDVPPMPTGDRPTSATTSPTTSDETTTGGKDLRDLAGVQPDAQEVLLVQWEGWTSKPTWLGIWEGSPPSIEEIPSDRFQRIYEEGGADPKKGTTYLDPTNPDVIKKLQEYGVQIQNIKRY